VFGGRADVEKQEGGKERESKKRNGFCESERERVKEREKLWGTITRETDGSKVRVGEKRSGIKT
jgi:hypothetical protein